MVLSVLQDNIAFIVIAQGIGLLGMATDLYAANQKSDNRLMRFIILASFIFAVHFSLLMAFSAAISEVITGVRYWLADKYKKLWIGAVFIALYIVMAVFIAEELIDYMPFFASVVGTSAVFGLSGIPMRLVFIMGQITWVIYSALVLSLGGFLLYIALITMTSITIYRLYKEKDKQDA